MLLKFLSKEQSSLLSFSIRSLDLAFYIACGIFSFYLQFHHLTFSLHYEIAFLWAALLVSPVFYSFGVYRSLRGRKFGECFRSLCVAFVVLVLLLAASAFITKTGDYYSRSWFLTWHLGAIATLLLVRVVLFKILGVMRKHGLNHKRIIIVGSSRLAADLLDRIAHSLWTGFEVIGIFDNHPATAEICGMKIQSIPAGISQYVEENKVEEVWLALSLRNQEEIECLINKLNYNVVTLRYFPEVINLHLLNHAVTEVLGFPVIDIIITPMKGINRLLKLLEDKILALLFLVLFSPAMLVVALLVKLSSPGPVFYRQKRISWNGSEFDMLKFRSMPVNAESKTGAVWAKIDDNRATKIGSFLRKTSLDELPQFINVLKGDMSIVGPRPERPEFVDKFKHEIPQYMQKHLVKAGITGWAQVNGFRGNTSLQRRIEHDIYYITHWSLWFDLKIIFLTVFKGFVNKNAY